MSNLVDWLRSGKYLPEKMQDFHDQKNLFKSMHYLQQDSEAAKNGPTWVKGHIYVIDCFLWFMASRGYTLQRTRKKGVKFLEWPDFRNITENDNIKLTD